MRPLAIFLAAISLVAAARADAETRRWTVLAGGEKVGFAEADVQGRKISIRYDVKNNGRGPTIAEQIELGKNGLPTSWLLKGTTTFGGIVDERFSTDGSTARWTDSMGPGEAPVAGPALYVAQNGSPWALGLYARALLKDADASMPALPGGTLALQPLGDAKVGGVAYRAFALSGIDLTPELILLDSKGELFASFDSGGATVREGHEAALPELSALATRLTAERYATLQQKLAIRLGKPLRIRNVRIFDPATGKLGDPVSLVVAGDRISGIQPLDTPASPGEASIDGKGGTILPGLHDMHAHVTRESALLYIAAGVTSVRDMGNDNGVLPGLIADIDSGRLAGPRIVPNGFLEGRSDYSARNGIIAASEAEAVDAVRWYAARDYWQVKIYNSMNPDWVPAIAREAHRLGMTVTGHIPAFTDADHMIAAGYDEITHINQLMLGWVLKPGEDTRTPLRLTAMRRMGALSLSAPQVTHTLDTMVAKKIAHDPTAVTLELLMLSRNGTPSPAVAAYVDHLPIGMQRRRRQAIAPIANATDAAEYDAAFARVKELLKLMHDRGIRLLPGTDDGTGISVHRELQIYGEAGIPNAEVLRLGTLAPEQYMGRDQLLGHIARGAYADFLLLPGNPLTDLKQLHAISMVVKGGTIWFPADIHKAVGIRPFAEPPLIEGR
ncbi:amidohydrolase family protein [Sandaracinobacteroides hominis]|uniref:amidohydrolase family protein n=1 Tax=Sandaracinobacteroides hominis TaxID=2780086 RepID=UPI0018F6D7F7|nr:amidohydrolase family protein [Sandaracinobacteroides hominis]